MNNKTPRQPFEELSIPRKELPKLSGRYRVYKDVENYITVEAASALEALKQCGVPQVYRIERDAIYLTNVLNLEALSNSPAPAAPAAAEAPVAAAASAPSMPEAQAAAAPPAADAPLSNTDVDKLLKSESATGAS